MSSGKADLAIVLLRQVGHQELAQKKPCLLARCHFVFGGRLMVCNTVMTDRNSSWAWLQHPIARN